MRSDRLSLRERVLAAVKANRAERIGPWGPGGAFALIGEGWSVAVEVSERGVEITDAPRFGLRAADTVWERLTAPRPEPGSHSLLALVGAGEIEVTGDRREYHRQIGAVRMLVEAIGSDESQRDRAGAIPTRPLSARGEYRRVTCSLGTADIYFERCGSGPPIFALATAGSGGSQWHGIMTETDLLDRYELISVDLPWHGRSSPIFGAAVGSWSLTPASYTDFILAALAAIEVQQPVLLGASMAGAAVVHAIATAPECFRAGVACQVGPFSRGRLVSELDAADIDQSRFVPEWTYGLMNPTSPAEWRKRVWWGYSSGGSGLYRADLASYARWEFDSVRALLTASSPLICVLSGSFDTSVPPRLSRQLASGIPNSCFEEMPELGHFPHAENPAVFAGYLERALRRIAGQQSLPPDI